MAKFLKLNVADEVVVDNVVDVSEPIRHVTLFFPVLENDAIPIVIKRVDHHE